MSKNYINNQSKDSNKFSKNLMSYVNDNEIGWEPGQFQKFKNYQEKKGVQKQNNKEFNFSNGVKRNRGNDDNGIKKQNNKELNISNGIKRNNVSDNFRSQYYKRYENNNK